MSDSEEILFIKGIKNIMTKNFLEFMLVKVRDQGDGKCKLLIISSFNLDEHIRPTLA